MNALQSWTAQNPKWCFDMEHRAIRQGDEMYCPVCRLRWGVDEEAPNADCIPAARGVEPPSYLKDAMTRRNDKRVTSEQWGKLRKWAEDGFEDGKRPDGI